LRYEKDGTKANPIRLTSLNNTDPEAVGAFLIQLYNKWKPGDEPKLGSLYGFDLYIRHHKEFYEQDKKVLERHFNTFYAERAETGIKYTYNQGHPNVDNPKLAARHFLNAIDRIDALKEKYTKTIAELDREIPTIEQIVSKPFEKEKELAEMKTTLAGLEREIAIKIQERQMKEQQPAKEEQTPEQATETVIIRMRPQETGTDNKVPQPVSVQRARTRKRSLGI
jgi:hypothetical protein